MHVLLACKRGLESAQYGRYAYRDRLTAVDRLQWIVALSIGPACSDEGWPRSKSTQVGSDCVATRTDLSRAALLASFAFCEAVKLARQMTVIKVKRCTYTSVRDVAIRPMSETNSVDNTGYQGAM